jgi:hypothetical protein
MMNRAASERRLAKLVAFSAPLLLVACATTTSLDDSYDSQSPNSVRMRLTTVATSSNANETVVLSATIQNGTTTEFRRFGCTRPALAIDSATATGWAELPALQLESLALCFSPYYIVSAGTTQAFETAFTRKSPALKFPRGVALRLRVIGETPEMGPVAPIVLP